MVESSAAKAALLKVLENLPVEARSKIRAYWASLGFSEPRVYELSAAEMVKIGRTQTTVAATEGATFYFRPELSDDAPLDVQEAIIAHELAHSFNGFDQEYDVLVERVDRVWNAPNGQTRNSLSALDEETRGRAETQADKVTKKWGYDLEKSRRWCAVSLDGKL